jgi:transposase, IS5 family
MPPPASVPPTSRGCLEKVKMPCTYRKKARLDFLNIALSKSPKASEIRTAIGKQQRYIKRNLGHIHSQLDNGASHGNLTAYWHKCLMVIHTVYDQQLGMYQQRSHRCVDRIVSISQPHVRPIVRGKVSQRVEFGAKISASHVDGFILLDRFSWDAYNETFDLEGQAEAFRQRFGQHSRRQDLSDTGQPPTTRGARSAVSG